MKLTPSTVDVLLSTLDQGSPVTGMPLGRLSNLRNTVVKKYQNPRAADGTVTHVRVQKRDGFQSTTREVRDLDGADAGLLAGTPQVFLGGDTIRRVANNRLYTLSKTWVKATNAEDGDTVVLPNILSTSDLYAADSQCEAPDIAVIDDISCTVWREVALTSTSNSRSASTSLAALDGVRVMFRDHTKGTVVRAPFTLNPAGGSVNFEKVRVIATNAGHFFVIQDVNTTESVYRIYVSVFDTLGQHLADDHFDTPSNGQSWDSIVGANDSVIIAIPNNGTGVKFETCTYATGSITFTSATDTTIKCEGLQCAWLLDVTTSGTTHWLATVSVAGGTTGSVWAYKIVASAQTHEYPVTVGTFTVGTQAVSGITGYVRDQTDPVAPIVVAYTLMDLVGKKEADQYGHSGTDPQNISASNDYPNQMHNQVLTSAVPFTGTSTTISLRLGMSLASRAFFLGGDFVAVGYYPARKWGPLPLVGTGGAYQPYRTSDASNFQPTWFILPLGVSQPIAGRFEIGLAAADWQVVPPTTGSLGPRNRCLTSVVNASNRARPRNPYVLMPLCYRAESSIVEPGAFSNIASGTNPSGLPAGTPPNQTFLPALGGAFAAAIVQAVQAASYQTGNTVGVREFHIEAFSYGKAFTVGKTTYWPGLMAAVTEAGQDTIVEHGLIAPECPWLLLTNTPDTDIYSAGTYFYRLVGEYTTGSGRLVQSLSTAAFSHKIVSGDNLAIGMHGNYIYPTNKKNVKISGYRTGIISAATQNSAPATDPPTQSAPVLTPPTPTAGYYKITSDLNPLYNRPLIQEFTFSDFLGQFTQGPPNQQIYTDLSHPKYPCPAFRSGCTWRNRVWVIAYDNTIWFSDEISDTEEEAFLPGMQIIVPTTERITAISPMDDFLIIFCTNSIWYIQIGAALPDRSPTPVGNIPAPIRLPFEMGCTGHVGVARQGVFYSSSQGGVWLITRGLDNVWVGQAAQDLLDSDPVTGADRLILDICVAGNYVVVNVRFDDFFTPDSLLVLYDTNLNAWMSWKTPTDSYYNLTCDFQNKVVRTTDAQVEIQTPGAYLDVNTELSIFDYVPMSLTISPVHIGGVRSWKRTWALQLQGKVYDPCDLNISLSYGDSGGVDATYDPVTLEVGELQEEVRPTKQLASSVGLTLSDSANQSMTGQGFSLEVVSFYVGLEKGLNKLAPSKRAKGG